MDKNATKATQLKDAGNNALKHGKLKLAWELYTTALRFAPDVSAGKEGELNSAALRRLRAVAFHNRSLTLMQYGKTVIALSTSGTVGMTEESERVLFRILIATMLDATEAIVADPTYAKAWHRLHSAMDTIEMRRRVSTCLLYTSDAADE